MNLEKFTDRAKGFLQSAQTVAIRLNHQRITPEHLLKALLEDSEGMAAGLIQRAGGNPKLAVDKVDELRKHMAENDGHLVTAQLTGNKELHLFMRDIVGLEIQHEANPDMMRAFSQRF